MPEPDVVLENRKVGEPDMSPGGAASSTADTSKRRESWQGSSANESSLADCIEVVNNLLCDVPTVDLRSQFPEDELKAGRELELQNNDEF